MDTDRIAKGLWTRWAPTPSGHLHAGNAANALLTFAMGRVLGARVLLRIDDLDSERVRQPYLDSIFRTMDALGLEPDAGPSGPGEMPQWSQRQRMPHYRQLLEALLPSGRVYACTCSRSQMRAALEAGQLADPCRSRILHPGATGRSGSEALYPDGAGSAEGEEPQRSGLAWKFNPEGLPEPTWTELLPQAAPETVGANKPAESDPVLLRRDGLPAYHIASLSDDIRFGIGLVVRGADLLDSTAAQIGLARLLEPRERAGHFEQGVFFHHPLLADRHGQKISKSAGNADAPDLDLGLSNRARLCALAADWLAAGWRATDGRAGDMRPGHGRARDSEEQPAGSANRPASSSKAAPASLTDLIAWIDENRPFAPAALEALAYLKALKNPS